MEQAMKRFKDLPLLSKLVVFAKLKHEERFKPLGNDLFGLSRDKATTIYNQFITDLRASGEL